FAHESDIPKPLAIIFDNILGQTRLFKSSHPPGQSATPKKLTENCSIVYHEGVYTGTTTQVKSVSKLVGTPNVMYERRVPWNYHLMTTRTTPVWSLFNGQSGFGHIGLDFWSV